MQGKGKFEIEFEGKIKIKKKSPAYSRAHILFNIWLQPTSLEILLGQCLPAYP